MKKLFVLICILQCNYVIHAQGIMYASLGYNMSFLHSDGLDFVIDRYNETRTYLDQPMPYCRYYDGLSGRIGGSNSGFLVDFGFTVRSCTVSATGIDNSGIPQQRDLKNKWNTLDLGVGGTLGTTDNFSFVIGVNTAFNSEKSLTRADTPDEIGADDFVKANSQFRVAFEPFIQFIIASDNGLGLKVRPYYSFTPITTDYYELNAYINPNTYGNDPYSIEGKLTGYGITFEICYFENNN